MRRLVGRDMQTSMPVNKKSSAPLTFDLPESLIAKIQRAKQILGVGTASEIVRLALARFDLNGFQPARNPHTQISVRIVEKLRMSLRRTAKQKDVTIGELIRAALEELPVKAPSTRKRR